MWPDPKQILSVAATILAAALTTPALAGSAGGIALGEARDGVADRAFVTAPPHYAYIVERASGSFLDCGEGMDLRRADADGRDVAPLLCGVTLVETIVIPAAAESARLIVHF